MAIANRELAIVIKVVNDQLVSGVNQAKTALTNFARDSSAAIDQVEERSENLSHVWKGMFEAFIGIEVVDVLKRVAEMADQASERLDVAANTARNFGNSLNPDEMERWLRAFAASPQGGGYALGDLRTATQKFAATGQDENQIKRAIADTTNLAATFRMDMPQAIQITQEALTGHVDLLTRYGIISREAAKHIHTVEDAMRALEQASAGGAEKRADGLAGAFGRLGNSVEKLADSFGRYLIPYFDATANGLSKIADAFAALPAWIQQAVAGLSFVTLSLTALGLLLPAIKLALEFLAGGFSIVRVAAGILVGGLEAVTIQAAAMPEVLEAVRGGFITTAEAEQLLQDSTGRTQGVLGLLRTFIGGPLVAVFNGFVGVLRTVITALLVDLVGADAAAAGSFAALISPILAVIAIIAGLVAAIVALSGHWDDVMKGLSTAWDEFYNNVIRKAGTLHSVLSDLAMALSVNPMQRSEGIALLKGDLGAAMPKTSAWVGTGVKDATNAIVGAVKTAWGDIVKFFTGGGAKVPIPKDAFTGTIPGGKDTAAQQAQNALKNFDEATKNWLDAFAARVTAAQAMVDASKARVDAYAASLPGGKPQNAQQEAQYEALLEQHLRAEQDLRARTLEQQQAQVTAAAHFEEIAKSISPHLKNHDSLVREALNAARQHNDQAEKLWATYQNLGVTLAQIATTARDIRDTTAQTAGQLLTDAAKSKLDATLNTNAAQVESVQHAQQQATVAAGGTLPKIQEDQFKKQLAQLALAAAQAKEELARYDAAVAAMVAATTHLAADQQKATAAYNALTAAHNTTIAAQHRLDEATDQLANDFFSRKEALKTALDDLVKKINLPGLTENAKTGGFSFSPYAFLLQAFEQTKAFADIMRFVNQIVKVFAQLLDNLRPVLDLVIRMVSDVANVFIFLYNTVARILRLFGIHLQLLSAINDAYGQQIPLIQITHNIPTLNELAAGKLNNPLSNTPIGSKGDNLINIGNTHTSLLESILATLIAIKLVEAVFGRGGGGGLMGFLGSLFKFGGHASAFGPGSSFANVGTLASLTPGGVATGTQAALAADGGSTSGGLFTATNNALRAATPYIAASLGAVVGSMIGGGGGMSQMLGGIGSIVGSIYGGPIGSAVGGFLGGIIGGLFGHHRSAPAPEAQQTTEFTALLHAATDVHAWMNQLTTGAASMLQGLAAATSSLATAASTLNKAADALKLGTGGATIYSTTNLGGVHLHNDLELKDLSESLSTHEQRRIRSAQFALGRGPIG